MRSPLKNTAKDSASRAQSQTEFGLCRGAAYLRGRSPQRKCKPSAFGLCRGAAYLRGRSPQRKCKPSAEPNEVRAMPRRSLSSRAEPSTEVQAERRAKRSLGYAEAQPIFEGGALNGSASRAQSYAEAQPMSRSSWMLSRTCSRIVENQGLQRIRSSGISNSSKSSPDARANKFGQLPKVESRFLLSGIRKVCHACGSSSSIKNTKDEIRHRNREGNPAHEN